MSVITISDGSFSKTVNTDEEKKPVIKKTKRYWRKDKQARAAYVERKKKGQHLPSALVSQATIDRLHREAVVHPLFIGMEEADVRKYIDVKRAEFLSRQPFWYGHTPGGDSRHRSNQRLYESRRDINTPLEETTQP